MIRKLLSAAAVAISISLSACGTVPPPTVTGNNTCIPSTDLPAHKVMKKVPEQVTLMDDLWGLFASERKDHGGDIRDYNSLYDQCVVKGAVK